MKRVVGVLVGSLVIARVIVAWWPQAAPTPSPDAAVAGFAPAATPAAESPPRPIAPELPSATPPASASTGPATAADEMAELPGVDPERLALIEHDPVLREQARQQALAAEADARWNEAVDRSDYSADDIDPAVRDLFRRLKLEPRYAEGGRIEGLVIENLAGEHPLAQAGFRAGDLLDSIQGVPLRDPGEIPSLLAHLGPHITFCADRGGEQLCREIVLE